jgi:Asp-tRNA(Asn)/Glu-tRNA(Gln) amidotransferase A subunit family amidase
MGSKEGTESARPRQPISARDLAAADRVAGRASSDSERQQMVAEMNNTRDLLVAVRARDMGTLEPALQYDPRPPGATYPRGKSRVQMSRGRTLRGRDNLEELAFAPVVELARLIKARKVSSSALIEMYLKRLKRYDPALHCVITLTEELARRQAARADKEIAAGQYRGPLHGIPWGAKDLIATRGIRTTWGAQLFENQVFDTDATGVERLDAAGAVLVAKLATGQLAGPRHWFGGVTRCPWNLEEDAGVSSSGPGSATAAGLVGFSLGTETLGSILSPCLRNGVTGLRPTFGRVSRYGTMALAWSLDRIGPICRGVEDCALVLGAIHGPDGRDSTVVDIPFRWNPRSSLQALRVGYDQRAFEECEPQQQPIYQAVLETLRGLRIELEPVTLSSPTVPEEILPTLMAVEAAAAFQPLLSSRAAADFAAQGGQEQLTMFRVGSTIPAVDYLQMMRMRRQVQVETAAALRDVDVYVTVPATGPSTWLTMLTGYPSLLARGGMYERRPLMIEFVGGLYREAAALRVALAYQQATTWHQHWPDMSTVKSLQATFPSTRTGGCGFDSQADT